MSMRSFTYLTATHSPLPSICNSPSFSNSPSFHWPFKSPLQQKRQRELDAFSLSPLLKGNKHTYTRLQPIIPQTQARSTWTDLYHYTTLYFSLSSLLFLRVRFSSFRWPRQDPYKIWKLQNALLKTLSPTPSLLNYKIIIL